jgi:hypothetical protein
MKFISLLLLIFSVVTGMSQNGAVRGFVYEEKSGEPVIFTNVYLDGTTYGAATDVNGFYNITKIPPGNYILTIAYVGYEKLTVPIQISANKIVNKKLYLKKTSVELEEFVVSAERQDMHKSIHASITKVTPKQMTKLPAMGTEPDLAQYLQVVPGVVFTGDQGGQLYIRGGSPIQNKVLLDGMIIYNPFHSIGFFSVFDADLIRNADIYTGGFNAQYGDRISSVMDITTRDGNKKRFKGKLSGDTFGSKLLLEAPIIKQKDNKGMSMSIVGSLKTSYLEKTSKVLYSYADDNGLPFGFTDVYGKLSLNGESGNKVNVFGFYFSDYVNNYKDISNLNWNSVGVGSNIVLVPSGSNALITANVAYSNYYIEMKSSASTPRSSGINGFNMGLTFTYFLGDDKLDYGFEVLGFRTDFNYFTIGGQQITQEENTSEFGGFIVYKKNFGKLIIEPGFRLQYYASLSEPSFEPRIGLKYSITNKLRLKGSAGFYSQNLIAANSDKDVVNLFYGFLSGTNNLPDSFNGKAVNSSLQKSRHTILGLEYELNKRIVLNIEGYYKNNNQLTELNRNKIMNDDASNALEPDIYKKDFVIEQGDAYGVDFLFKYDYKGLYLWCVYSLSKVTRLGEFINNAGEVEIRTYAPHFDRCHNINLMASYTFGNDLNWEVGARWNFGSGFPYTPTAGNYEKINLTDGIMDDYTSANGELAYLLGDINTYRLPSYHRFDVNIKRTFYISDRTKIQLSGSITNVYNRRNIFYIDRIKAEKVYQLPILPSVGLSITF